ncbi:DUF302 domain-containing protein [Granulicella sp. L60]|uniref:DUF302 domain-containing protein n=1 Tax=Granulicella sp. L60 TaxID=1641866 RepID=UPI00131AF299|nr:DUF302 domain-containing protein [Granulicella sp. L60]
MTTKKILVDRVTFVSNSSFEEVLERLDKGIGRKNFGELARQMSETRSFEEFSEVIHGAVGSADLMEFLRLDLGAALRRDPNAKPYKIVRIIAGNPLIMKQMTESVPDAGSYAPVTILVYERGDGVHVSYDTMASHLAGAKSERAMQVAKDLDAKVLHLLEEATAPQ